MVNPKKRLTAQQALEHPWILHYERRANAENERGAAAAKQGRPAAHAIHAHSANDLKALSDSGADPCKADGADQAPAGPAQGEHSDERSADGESARPSEAGASRPSGGVNFVKAALGKLKLGSGSAKRE